jgi:hypothetical protein
MPEWGEMFYAVPKQDPRELDHDQEDRLFAALRTTFRTSPASRCCQAGG